MKVMLDNINKSKGLVFVYSTFRTLEGVELFSKVLDFNGYAKYGTDNDLKKYAIYSGVEDELEKKETLKVFTSNENKHGKFIKILLVTSSGAEGLDLKNIRQIHIMEPYWNQMRIEQIIGRGIRRGSHLSLAPAERNVEVFRYFSILPKNNISLSKDKVSTDQHIEQISLKKQYIIDELKLILKECAFDCFLNKLDIKSDYKCFSFGTNGTGFSYNPNLSKDVIDSYSIKNTKIIQKKYTKIIYYEGFVYLYDTKKKIFYLYNDDKKIPVEVDLKKSKSLYVDMSTNHVYDVRSVHAENPVKLFTIDKKSKLKKLK